MTTTPSCWRSQYVRCRRCGAVLPGWPPMPDVPDGALLLGHLAALHRPELKPYLQHMATEDIGTVAMAGFERVDAPRAANDPRPTRRSDSESRQVEGDA